MKNIKKAAVLAVFILAVSLISASAAATLTTKYYSHVQFDMLTGIVNKIIEEQPQSEAFVMAALKKYKNQSDKIMGEDIVARYGYTETDFLYLEQKQSRMFIMSGVLIGSLLFLFLICYGRRKRNGRIKSLTNYLENINTDKTGMLMPTEEDAFSALQDEIYKTVTSLNQTRDEAVKAKTNFADNLSNIAHQLKTPITAASLSIQLQKEETRSETLEEIQKQLDRIRYLEEALLLLSRMDAGTLPFLQQEIDVFTVLMLAADNLNGMQRISDINIEIPEKCEVKIMGDLDWTMEAIMNLMKNCMEHAPSGSSIHCDYNENPLYVEICIWDEGQGFSEEDLPHLFERFYGGRKSKTSVGIGLSIAKAIFELENGIIQAKNLPAKGACFEIRIYSH